ncbi:hypothetical protein CYMTET_25656 [Cymbomonas tetramitiformis]|uniref:Sensitive to high expression protein 9, mitochondrial n=1 Tax=Cymbomonas tetramitiformis TaxID=36881 RepID=A0AAE0KYQ5_9CHLO|nr:hypothetical protein CYMTET_25656 [Cymbomonas tetramitiformis]
MWPSFRAWFAAVAYERKKIGVDIKRFFADADLTGVYKEVEKLKQQEAHIHGEFLQARSALKKATEAYKEASSHGAATHGELNSLLARRLEWSPADVQRFAELNQKESFQQVEGCKLKERLEACLNAVDTNQALWLRAVEQHRKLELTYIENSRQLGTYASLGLISLNTLIFAASVFVIEPYRNRIRLEAIQDAIQKQSDLILSKLEGKGQISSTAGRSSSRPSCPAGEEAQAVPSLLEVMAEVRSALGATQQRLQSIEAQCAEQWTDVVRRLETHRDPQICGTSPPSDVGQAAEFTVEKSAQRFRAACLGGLMAGALVACITLLRRDP